MEVCRSHEAIGHISLPDLTKHLECGMQLFDPWNKRGAIVSCSATSSTGVVFQPVRPVGGRTAEREVTKLPGILRPCWHLHCSVHDPAPFLASLAHPSRNSPPRALLSRRFVSHLYTNIPPPSYSLHHLYPVLQRAIAPLTPSSVQCSSCILLCCLFRIRLSGAVTPLAANTFLSANHFFLVHPRTFVSIVVSTSALTHALRSLRYRTGILPQVTSHLTIAQ